jgi:hypothetical protein
MLLTLFLALTVAGPQQPSTPPDPVPLVIAQLERAALAGDAPAVVALADKEARPGALEELASVLTQPAVSRVVIKERDRTPLGSDRLRILLEIFTERGGEAMLGTWSVDVQPAREGAAGPAIVEISRLSVVSGLFRLALDPTKAYAVHDLTITAPDLTLQLSSGRAWVAETPAGPTAIVLMGRGRMQFTPPDAAERSQVRIFSNHDALSTDFDAAFIRIRPEDFPSMFPAAAMKPEAVDGPALRRATAVFDDYIGRTLQLDLSDMSRDRWSLLPQGGDLIAEVRTRRYGSLTYARSRSDAEDIAVFDRRRRRNIAVYASAEKLAQRGRYYSEDDLVDYDVLAYDLDLALTPDRLWVEGISRLKVKIRAASTPTLTLRLAEPLTVRGVFSPQFGRLLHLRVVGQNSLIVNLPGAVVQGTEFWLSVAYGGRVQPQAIDREALSAGQDMRENYVPMEPHFIYSHRSYWYPQSTVTDYAPARLRLTVPAGYDVVATGQPAGPPAPPPGVAEAGQKGGRVFVFDATEPVRYLACVISRFTEVETLPVPIAGAPEGTPAAVSVTVQANPRQTGRVRNTANDAADVIRFYASVIGGAPYQSFAIAATESDRPGGHSPPYFAVLNQVVLQSDLVWRNDPVSFENFPMFYLAHEIAHQWWGHAVGWKNYHEQWISEGFSQYFAALYAEQQGDGNVLDNLLRQMRHTAIASSDQGPIYLGYRLGHIRGDDRAFRAVIYNKGAMVLHMLRRLVGDGAFFSGVRAFYEQWRFRKAGTDDFRVAMEKASGRDLSTFFEYWIHGASVPDVKFTYDVDEGEARLRFEQRDAIEVAVTVRIAYKNGGSSDVVVTLSDRVTDVTVPLKDAVRDIVANADNAALIVVQK